MDSEDKVLTPAEVADAAAASIQGLTLAEVFTTGPRRLFVERVVPRHGIYRLYVSRPFGARKAAGLRFRIQITVQFDGQDVQHSVNDGQIIAQLAQLGAVIVGAAEQMEEHIKANRQTVHKLRRAAMEVCTPDAVLVTPGDGDAAHGDAGLRGALQ